jgi:hypothetical protein
MSQDNRNNWTMPEPIFRQSDGEAVKQQGSLGADPEQDKFSPDLQTAAAPDDPLALIYAPPEVVIAPPTQPTPAPPVPVSAVQPQPFISEQFTAERIIAESKKPAKKRSMRAVVILLVMLLVLGVVAVAAVVLYLRFFAGTANTGGF